MILSYFEFEDLLREELNKVTNIKGFCEENNLQSKYHLIIRIKNKKTDTKYTNLVIELLSIFGYEIVKLVHFKTTKSKNYEGKYYDPERKGSE